MNWVKRVVMSAVCFLFWGFASFAQDMFSIATTEFPIATTENSEFCLSGTFDGTNFLVVIVEETGGKTTLTAQMLSQSGTLVGNKIIIPESNPTDIRTLVAFDGTNYFIVWTERNGLKGQFIDKSGTPVGSIVSISSDIESIGHIGFGGGKYLVVYNKEVPYEGESEKRSVFGRTITPSGEVGSEFRINTTGYGKEYGGIGNLAFDGTNFLVVWTEDTYDSEIRAALVSPDGEVRKNFSIDSNSLRSDNPCAVAFDGTNYLVVWPDEIEIREVDGCLLSQWFLFGQLFDTEGNAQSGIISISAVSSPCNIVAPSAIFDGTNYLITWNRCNEETGWDIIGRFVSKDGNPLGSEIAIDNDQENQMGGAVKFINGQYLVLVNNNFSYTQDVEELVFTSGGDVYGVFKTIKTKTVGNINGDEGIDISDVILVLRMALGLPITINGQTYNYPYNGL